MTGLSRADSKSTIFFPSGDYLNSARYCLELAMMIEVQGLDLYPRMGLTCADASAKELFYQLGEEEKCHLNSLADLGANLGL